MSWYRLALLSTLGGWVCGCGGSSSGEAQKTCYPVKGQLFISGKAAEGANIIFAPTTADPGSTAPRPRATVGPGGEFSVTTYSHDDGAPAGDYGLIVFWPAPELDDRLQGRLSSPDKTKRIFTIKTGDNQLGKIEFK